MKEKKDSRGRKRSSNKKSVSSGEGALDGELISTSNAIIIGIDLEGKISLFNDGAEKTLGYRKDEVIGNSWFSYLLDYDENRDVFEVFNFSVGGGARTKYQNLVRSRSGQPLSISWENTVIYDDDGNVSMILMVGQDISEMKRLEETLRRQSEKLLKALDDISLYSDLMLHDIHNINAAIMAHLELLGMPGIDEKRKNDHNRKAIEEVRRVSEIIRDVKILSNAKLDSTLEPVSLSNIVKRSLDTIGKEIRGEVAYTPEALDFKVLADGLIQKVVERILRFPYQYSTKNKMNIKLSAKPMRGESVLEPDMVELVVGIKGLQIDRDDEDKLFTKLLDKEKKLPGSGMVLVRKLVERYRGSVWITDLSGRAKGTEIHLKLIKSD